MKKISFLIGSLGGGGAERVTVALADYFCESGYEVFFIVFSKANNNYRINPKIKIDYLPENTGKCAIFFRIKELKKVDAILLTHGHFDHVGGVKEIAAETGCDVYLCADELTMPPQMTAGQLYYTKTYGEGDTLHLAGLTISVIRTPGHTPGSVCLLIDDAMFSGDTLFASSCGRTDFPGGSDAAMRASLRRLAGLSTDYRVYPGHGMDTTLAEEKRYNPYLR